MGELADVERIDPNWFGDVLEFGWPEIARREMEAGFDLPVGVLRHANAAGFGDALEPRGDVDAVPQERA